MAAYDRTVTEIERDMIMSTEKTALPDPSNRRTKGNPIVEQTTESSQPSVENIDVTALQIDETFDAACDPYNSTGQFLADAVKRKYDDQ